MKSSTHDKAEGTFKEVKGKIKEEIGDVTNNRDLEERGRAEKNSGKVQQKVGDVKKVFDR